MEICSCDCGNSLGEKENDEAGEREGRGLALGTQSLLCWLLTHGSWRVVLTSDHP